MKRSPQVTMIACGLLLGASAALMAQGVLTNADVIKMTKAELSDNVIINSIKTQPAGFDLSADAMIALKKAGVTDEVIEAMQEKVAGLQAGGERATASGGGGKATAGRVSVPDGTEVTVRLVKTLSSADARLDDEVKLEAAADVAVNGVVVIAKGSSAHGRVLLAESRKSFGRRGKLDFSVDNVEAVDGQKIRLRYEREMRGDSKYGKAGVVTFLAGPFGFFVKGKDVEIPAGTEYTIFIDGERTIELRGNR